jgi:serine/threonine protein kinase
LDKVVREFGNNGIVSSRRNLTEEISLQIISQIISGLNHCHQLNISHRDIKLENVLVDMNSDNLQTKIIDFGFATQTQEPYEKLRAFCGTPAYMSP